MAITTPAKLAIAEEIPTKAVIPKKIISMVIYALNLFPLMESVATLIFSLSKNAIP